MTDKKPGWAGAPDDIPKDIDDAGMDLLYDSEAQAKRIAELESENKALKEAVRELALLHKQHQEPHYYNDSIGRSCPAAWDKYGKCDCWVDEQDAKVVSIVEQVLPSKGE
jgi:hypothetical protein